jgi:hypothetical protein
MQPLIHRSPVALALGLVLFTAAPARAAQASEDPAEVADLRHAVVEDADGVLHALSSAHGYWARFDRRGLTVGASGTADAVGFGFRLATSGFGREGALEPVDGATDTRHEGRRVERRFGPNLTEWYVNHDRGLEHGFTVDARPRGAGELVVELELELAPGLRAALSADLRTVVLFDAHESAVARYAGLVAFDADTVDLDARFELDGDLLRIRVDDEGARYPLTIDPIVESAYIKASNTDAFDEFGFSVAIWGDTAVVGAPGEDASSTLGENDDSVARAGAAYVFVRSGSTWVQQDYLKSKNTDPFDEFGFAVAIHEDIIAVGMPTDDSSRTLVGGGSADNGAPDSGAVWIFERVGSTWSPEAFVKASNTESGDGFGFDVALCKDVLVVGAPFEDGGSTGIGGDDSNNGAEDAGAVYVYRRGPSGWEFEAYVKASNAEAGDVFGVRVAASNDTFAVSASREDGGANGVNGNQLDESAQDSGAVYVFVDTGSWSQQAYVKATNSDAGDEFGVGLDLDGDVLVVGAPDESSSASGVNGSQLDNSLLRSGAAYVFVRSGAFWSPQAYLKADASDALDQFGTSVAVSDGLVVVGAPRESGNSTGVGGDPTSDGSSESGAAYLFAPTGFTWESRAYLKASNTGSDDNFGVAVAVHSDRALVGAFAERSNATGVAGDGSDNSLDRAGAAYAFDLGFWNLVPGCFANPTLFLPPQRNARIGEVFQLDLQASTVGSGVAAIYYGASGVNPFGCGTQIGFGQEVLLAFAPLPSTVGLAVVLGGSATQPVPIPDDSNLVGIRLSFQAVVVDTTTFAFEYSQGLEAEILP